VLTGSTDSCGPGANQSGRQRAPHLITLGRYGRYGARYGRYGARYGRYGARYGRYGARYGLHMPGLVGRTLRFLEGGNSYAVSMGNTRLRALTINGH
jgi:hypothetical protein